MNEPDKQTNSEAEDIRSSVIASHPSVSREKNDPKIGHEPVSLWAFVICAVALVAGGSYLGATNGGFDYDHYTIAGYQPEPPAGVDAGAAAPKDPIKEWRLAGKRVYSTTCNGCHQASGLGLPGQYPPLVNSEWVNKGTERLAQIILKGLHGPIEVNGQAYGSIDMPPHGDKLSDTQIAQVMSYVRYEFENGIEEIVTKEMVAEARKRHGDFPGSYSVADLAPADAELPGAAPAPAEGETPAPAAETPAS